jgi:hypothetical protein
VECGVWSGVWSAVECTADAARSTQGTGTAGRTGQHRHGTDSAGCEEAEPTDRQRAMAAGD